MAASLYEWSAILKTSGRWTRCLLKTIFLLCTFWKVQYCLRRWSREDTHWFWIACYLCKIKNVLQLWDLQAPIQSNQFYSSYQKKFPLVNPLSREIPQCHQLLVLLRSHQKFVILQWIPDHCSLNGSEQANFLAKKKRVLRWYTVQNENFIPHLKTIYLTNYATDAYQDELLSKIETKYGRNNWQT